MKTQLLPSPRLARTGSLGPLSDAIIPATSGKVYVYQTVFDAHTSLYVLMDCKANKARPLAQATALGREVSLFVTPHDTKRAHVCSVKAAHAQGLLGAVDGEMLGEAYVAQIAMTPDEFYELCERKDPAALVEICTEACAGRHISADIEPNAVIAVMTNTGKYGLFLATELTPTSVSIDASHILAP